MNSDDLIIRTDVDLLDSLDRMENDLFQAFAILAWMGIGENGDEPEE